MAADGMMEYFARPTVALSRSSSEELSLVAKVYVSVPCAAPPRSSA
jgi:hypothetical protein